MCSKRTHSTPQLHSPACCPKEAGPSTSHTPHSSSFLYYLICSSLILNLALLSKLAAKAGFRPALTNETNIETVQHTPSIKRFPRSIQISKYSFARITYQTTICPLLTPYSTIQATSVLIKI